MLNATPILRAYSKIRLAKINKACPKITQQRQLLELISLAKDTKFGKKHNFASIRSISEYQKNVPLRTYEQFWNEELKEHFPVLNDITWPGTIPFFAVSSGTSSGKTKYIPVSHEMVKSNTKAGTDLLIHHLNNRPNSQIMGGRSFMLGGSTDLVEAAPGIFSGDLSGIAAKTLPWWAKQRFFPPAEMALIKDWEEKIERFCQESLKTDIRMFGGVPSWMLIFLKRMWDIKPEATGTIHKVFNNLELLVHGGVNFAPYFKQFSEILNGSHAELREVYPASEGFIAVADRGYGDGLRLILDHGIFFEFIPLEQLGSSNPNRYWIGDVEVGKTYAIALTTCAGLWSYVIGDTVTFVDRNTPRILVSGRTSYFLSAFGEHLVGDEIEKSVSLAAQEISRSVTDFSVGALYPANVNELGGHLFIVEIEGGKPSEDEIQKFATKIDHTLCGLNDDYEAHRASGFGLNPPKVRVVQSGTFAAWMKSRGKLGGQNKVPRIINDRDLFDNLKSFTE